MKVLADADEPITITEITKRVDDHYPFTCTNIRELESAGLVTKQRDANRVYCEVNSGRVMELSQYILGFAKT